MPLVYQATNTVNGKRYIGVTRKNLDYRKVGHEKKARNEPSAGPFHRAIRKYGAHSFRWEILEEIDSYEAALAREVELIAAFCPEYNIRPGGDRGWHLTPEQRARMGAPKIGKKASAETKAKMSAAHMGHSVSEKSRKATAERNRTRVWDAESKDKIRRALKGVPHSAERAAKAAAALMGRPATVCRKVMCLDDGLIFGSGRDAERFYDMPKRSVSQLCTRPPQASRFKRFKYISEIVVVSQEHADAGP